MQNFRNYSLCELLNMDPKLITDDILDFKLRIKANPFSKIGNTSNSILIDNSKTIAFNGYNYVNDPYIIRKVLNETFVSKKFILENANRIGFKYVILYADAILTKEERIKLLKDNINYVCNTSTYSELNQIQKLSKSSELTNLLNNTIT